MTNAKSVKVPVTFAALICALSLADCGSSNKSSHTTTSAGVGQGVAFADCMRSHGVSSFPDPTPGGGYAFPVNSSPTFKSAQAKCQKLLPNGGAPPAFSEPALMQLQRIAPCMRQHGVPDFPDPKRAPEGGLSSVNSGYRIIDYRGVLLELPATINMQSPAYKQAAATCGAPFLVL